MTNLRFNFKMDLIEISTVDFAFAENYTDLETNPFLEKSYPEDGSLQGNTIVIPLTEQEAQTLPVQFYALATINFTNGAQITAHAFKVITRQAALSAILQSNTTDYNIDFFIDNINTEPVNYNAGNGIDITNETISAKIKNDATNNVLTVSEDGLQVSMHDLGYNQEFRYKLSDPLDDDDNFALASRFYVQESILKDSGRYSYTVKTSLEQATSRNAYLYARIEIEGEYTAEQINNTKIVLYDKQGQVIRSASAFTSGGIDISEARTFKIYTTLQNSFNINYCVYNPFIRTREVMDGLNKKQKTINASNKLNADYINDTSSTKMLIPKPTIADEGKVLRVNANGEPVWVVE